MSDSDRPVAKRQANMVNGGKLSIEEVFAAMKAASDRGLKYIRVAGLRLKPSDRYTLFYTKGTICVACGLEATHFRKERFPCDKNFHLNLYAIDHMGDEVLFTKDHIIPKGWGGVNKLENYQTMCMPCNSFKGDTRDR